ncbi:MAG: DUF3107 domain-containing protein [Propionibacteriaceae bacterium]|nr:DUF3107 domain-containing protein [Propionibacteriaceae bacterium]
MDVRIGISDSTRELQVRTPSSADEIVAALGQALKNNSLFELTDDKGRRVVIPAGKLAYLDLGAVEGRPVGFGAL